MYSVEDHTFIICAYKQSQYLEERICSIISQNKKSNVIIATSTPNKYIENLGKKYNIEVVVNNKQEGIAADWNFAYSICKTALVTLAHQDDIYGEKYTEEILKNINQSKQPLIAFSNYAELRGGLIIYRNKLLLVKRILLSPLKWSIFWNSIIVRRRVLSLGSAICCPSVTLVKNNLPSQVFSLGMKSNIDWEAWEKISRMKGAFVYCAEVLMCHRIHEESTTTDIIRGGERCKEDYMMFRKFWPNWFAVIWTKLYRYAEKNNKV